MTGKRKSNRTYLFELYALTEKLKAEGKSDEAARFFDTAYQKKRKLFQRMLEAASGFGVLDPTAGAVYLKDGILKSLYSYR